MSNVAPIFNVFFNFSSIMSSYKTSKTWKVFILKGKPVTMSVNFDKFDEENVEGYLNHTVRND